MYSSLFRELCAAELTREQHRQLELQQQQHQLFYGSHDAPPPAELPTSSAQSSSLLANVICSTPADYEPPSLALTGSAAPSLSTPRLENVDAVTDLDYVASCCDSSNAAVLRHGGLQSETQQQQRQQLQPSCYLRTTVNHPDDISSIFGGECRLMPSCNYCDTHQAREDFGDFSNNCCNWSSSSASVSSCSLPGGCGLQLIADPCYSCGGTSAAHTSGDGTTTAACQLRHQQQWHSAHSSCGGGDPPASTTGSPPGPASGLHCLAAAASQQPPSLPGYWQQQQPQQPHVDAGFGAMNALYNQLLYNQLFTDQCRLLGLQPNELCQLDNYSINGLIQQQANVAEAVSETSPANCSGDPSGLDTTVAFMPGGNVSCRVDSAELRRQPVGRTVAGDVEEAAAADDVEDDASTDGDQQQQRQSASASNSSTSSSEEMRSMKVQLDAALRVAAPPSPTVQPDSDVDECDADADVLGSSPSNSLSYADRLRMMVAHRGGSIQQQQRRGSLDPGLLQAAGRKTSAPGFAASLIGQSGYSRRGSTPLAINSEGSTYRGLGAALGPRGAPLDFENLKLKLEKLMTGPASDVEKKTGGCIGGTETNETAKTSVGSAVSPPAALTATSSTSSPTNLQLTTSTATTSIPSCTIPSGTHTVTDKALTNSAVNPVTSHTIQGVQGVNATNHHHLQQQPQHPPMAVGQNFHPTPPPPPPGSPYGFELADMSDVVAYVIKTSPLARMLIDFVTQQALQYDKGFHAMLQRHRQEQSNMIGRQQLELNSLQSLFATNPLTMAAVLRAAQGQLGHPPVTSCSSVSGVQLPWWTDPSSAGLYSQYQLFLPASQQQSASSSTWSQQNQGTHHMTCPPVYSCATDDSAADDDDDQLQALRRSKTLDAGEMRRLRRFSLGNLTACDMPPRLRQILMGSSVNPPAAAAPTTNSTADHFDQYHRRQSESAVTVSHSLAGNSDNRPIATVHASTNPALAAMFSSTQVPSVPPSSSSTAAQPSVARVTLPADGRTGFGSITEAPASFPIRTASNCFNPGFPNNISNMATSSPSAECREAFAKDSIQATSSLLQPQQYFYGTLQQQQQQLMQMQQQAQLIMQQRQLQQYAQQQQQLQQQQQQQFLAQSGAFGFFPQWTHHG